MGDETTSMKSASPEQALFAGALQCTTPAARQAYLQAGCGGDATLRRRVEALLLASDNAGEFLESPPTAVTGGAGLHPQPGEDEYPGARIGRYKLLEKIGEGGCGAVYLADQEEPVRRRVALKIVKLGMDTRSVVARFEAERQALALMDHPSIAKVLDGGATLSGRPYFVMELVRGVPITRFCDEAKLSTEERLRLFVQVCQAIQHAHQKGIIHRDLKPSNILITVNDGAPVPKVIDFGIAKAIGQKLTDKTLFTQFHSFIGTPAYTSPEQAEMSSVDIDTRSDIYSLGVLLYELLTGKTPFDGEELLRSGLDEMRRIIRNDEPPRPSNRLTHLAAADAKRFASTPSAQAGPLRRFIQEKKQLVGRVRGDLDWIVMKCLEKDRARRYETANGLAADIVRHLQNEPVAARPPSAAYALRKLARRNRGALAAAAAVFLALLGGVLALAASNARIRSERNQKDRALSERSAALEAAHASEQDAREQLFNALQSQAEARRNSGRMGQRNESLAALTAAAKIRRTPELRDHAIAAMALPDVESGPEWEDTESDFSSHSYDEAYRRSVHLRKDGTIVVRSVPENRELKRWPAPSEAAADPAAKIALSPDGRIVARIGGRGDLVLWRWETGESILPGAPDGCSAIAFSPDGRWLAASLESQIACFDLGAGRELVRWPTLGPAWTLAFNPDGRRLAVGYPGGADVSIYDARTGTLERHLPTGGSARTIVAWHPAGELLAADGFDARIQIWNAAAGRQIAVLEGHAEQVTALSFHPDGELLGSASWDGGLRIWKVTPGRPVLRVPFTGSMVFGNENRWAGVILPSNTRAQLFRIEPSREYRTFLNTFPAGETLLREGHISTDGRLVAFGTTDGVRLWETASGRELAWIPGRDTTAVLFSPDGRELMACGPLDGLRKWSFRWDRGSAEPPRIGPLRSIPLPFAPARMERDSAGRTLAVVGESPGQCVLLDLASEKTLGPEMPHLAASFVALSPDGQRIASSGWHSRMVRVWNARSGELVSELEAGLTARVFFTPDDRELIVSRNQEFSFRDPVTLRTIRQISRHTGLHPGFIAFTADGKMMAVETAPGLIELKETGFGRTVARLEDPHRDLSTWLGFSPDGTQLVVAARYAGAIHRWDLRSIRARLKAMNLDWDWPEFASPERLAATMDRMPSP